MCIVHVWGVRRGGRQYEPHLFDWNLNQTEKIRKTINQKHYFETNHIYHRMLFLYSFSSTDLSLKSRKWVTPLVELDKLSKVQFTNQLSTFEMLSNIICRLVTVSALKAIIGDNGCSLVCHNTGTFFSESVVPAWNYKENGMQVQSLSITSSCLRSSVGWVTNFWFSFVMQRASYAYAFQTGESMLNCDAEMPSNMLVVRILSLRMG